jgi:hypothetical protein
VAWIGLVLATGIHLAGTQLRITGPEHKAAKPLTTQFVKRQPRLTKPLELRKRPVPKRRRIQREMVSVKARVSRQGTTSRIQTAETLRSLVLPRTTVARATGLEDTQTATPVLAQAIQGTKEAHRVVDMSLEMVDVQALDTGRYQAMVIQDPTDRRNIKGYLHLVLIHVMSFAGWTEHPDSAIRRLVEGLSDWTDIEADVTITSDITSPVALQTPWIYVLAYKPFELTPEAYEAVGKYITSGGFLFCDEDINVASASYITVPRAFLRMCASGLEAQGLVEGRDWHTGKVPRDHPLFHCYFDFEGPPIGYGGSWMRDYPIYFDEPMIGVFLRNALVCIITRRSYHEPWNAAPQHLAQRPRSLQFGINTIIYALTREGSITNQVMETVR